MMTIVIIRKIKNPNFAVAFKSYERSSKTRVRNRIPQTQKTPFIL